MTNPADPWWTEAMAADDGSADYAANLRRVAAAETIAWATRALLYDEWSDERVRCYTVSQMWDARAADWAETAHRRKRVERGRSRPGPGPSRN